jgi:hypothetical protein
MTDEVATIDGQVVSVTDTAPGPGESRFPIKGRDITVRAMNPAQTMVLGGLLRRARNGTLFPDEKSILDVFGKVFALIESLIVHAADTSWLEGEILGGRLEIEDFAGILSVTTDDAPAEKKKPRRAR